MGANTLRAVTADRQKGKRNYPTKGTDGRKNWPFGEAVQNELRTEKHRFLRMPFDENGLSVLNNRIALWLVACFHCMITLSH